MLVTETIALSRQMALRRQMEMIANNIANMNTTGFKSEAVLLREDSSVPKIAGISNRPLDKTSMVLDWGMARDMRGGAIKQTGNPMDVAIDGKGFFAVTTANGQERFTRNGVFQLNADGQMVDLAGDRVQGDGGEINIPPGSTNISIGPDGTISTKTGVIGKLRVATFENEQALKSEGNNSFSAGDQAPQTAEKPKVIQGALEGSNVNSVAEMTQMIDVQRQYQQIQTMAEEHSSMIRNAITKISRVS